MLDKATHFYQSEGVGEEEGELLPFAMPLPSISRASAYRLYKFDENISEKVVF